MCSILLRPAHGAALGLLLGLVCTTWVLKDTCFDLRKTLVWLVVVVLLWQVGR